MASLMDIIMQEYGGAKPQPTQAPAFPQVYGPLTRQLATEVPLGNGAMPGGALARELATNVPLPNGSLPGGALTRQLATEVPVPTGPFIPQAPMVTAAKYPNDAIARYREFVDSGAMDRANFGDENAIPNPFRAPMRPSSGGSASNFNDENAVPNPNRGMPARQQGFFEQLFKGPQYQSNNMPVNAMPQGPMPGTGATMPSYINWGDPNNAADFFRADALLQQQNPGFFGLLGGGNG